MTGIFSPLQEKPLGNVHATNTVYFKSDLDKLV